MPDTNLFIVPCSYSPKDEKNGLQWNKGGKEKIDVSLKLDKLSLLIPIPSGYQDSIKQLLLEWKYDEKHKQEVGLVATGPKPKGGDAQQSKSGETAKGKDGSTVVFDLKVPIGTAPLIWSKENAARLQLRTKKGGEFFLRLELHPLGLTTSGFEHILNEVLLLLDIHRDDILASKVSRLDVALDLKGVRLQDYAWRFAHAQLLNAWSRSGTLRTIYFGSPKHGASCIYDKAHQQKLDKNAAWTRLEYRTRKQMQVAGLASMDNPFHDLRVTDVKRAMEAMGASLPHRLSALAHAQAMGTRSLLETYPDTKGPHASQSPRQKLKAALEAATPTWFQPDEAWKLWPVALATALPGIFDQ